MMADERDSPSGELRTSAGLLGGVGPDVDDGEGPQATAAHAVITNTIGNRAPATAIITSCPLSP